MKKITLFLYFIFSFIFLTSAVSAQTVGQLENELASKKAQYESNQSKKQLTQEEKNKVQNEINNISNQMDQINKEIDNLNNDIKKRNAKIKSMKSEIKQIISYYQISDSQSDTLEYIFGASSFTDFIYRMSVSEQLSKYREDKINEYNKLIKENEKKMAEMNSKNDQLKELQVQQNEKYKSLESELVGITTVGVSLKDEINSLQASVNLYKVKYKCSSNEQISSCVNRNSRPSSGGGGYTNGNTNIPSASGFYVPISSWTRVYPFHHHDNGLDLSTSEGHAVTPIADGVVLDIWTRYNCGGNMVWINHNVNGRRYTSAYFHLKSINVSLDQKVTHNTVIGYTGGQTTKSYDSCTTGAHLHLQVATGNYGRTLYSPHLGPGDFHINYSAWNRNSIDPASLINIR